LPNPNFATIDINFGGKGVDLVRVEVNEGLSELFVISADILTETEIDLTEKLGTSVTVTIQQDDEPQRYFNGIYTSGEYFGKSEAHYQYRLILRPIHYLYTHTKFYAIYQDKTASDIIELTTKRCNIPWKPSAPFGISREYCVQYNESDFAFITRLMEEEGVYYYFKHEKGKHTLMACFNPSHHSDGHPAELEYNPSSVNLRYSDTRGEAPDYFVQTWNERVSTNTEQTVVYTDYIFQDASNIVKQEAPAKGKARGPATKVSVHAGTRDLRADAVRSASHMELIESGRQLFTGNALTPNIACGMTFTLTKHDIGNYNGKYLLTRVNTIAYGSSFETDGGGGDDSGTFFECVRAGQTWRAPMSTPRPLVYGAETAIVVGPEGETIYTDEWGRVRVKFHWESGVADDRGHDLTCWIRVSNTGGLGNIILPRVGHEVVVDFLGGNPDRPLIVGRVFNSNNKPIYGLPGNKTRALWRTLTYGDKNAALGDGAKDLDTGNPGAHELRFEDLSGSEEIFLHSQRDMNTRIRNDESHHVGRDQLTKIGQDSQREVGRDSLVKIGKNSTVEVELNEERTIKGTHKTTVSKDTTIVLMANADYKTTGTNTVKVDGENKEEYGDKSTMKVGDTLKITSGTNIEVEAKVGIKLTVGTSSIEINQMGVTIKGTMLSFEGQAMAEMKSPLTTVKGDGILTLKGGIVLIN